MCTFYTDTDENEKIIYQGSAQGREEIRGEIRREKEREGDGDGGRAGLPLIAGLVVKSLTHIPKCPWARTLNCLTCKLLWINVSAQ